MARVKINNWAVDAAGDIVAGATVAVADAAGNAPTLYTAETGAGTKANPFTADAGGGFEFWVDPGIYDVTVGTDPSADTLRIYPGVMFTPEAYGAAGDGVTDDTAAMQAALDAAAAAGDKLTLTRGKTYLAYALKVGVDLDLNGATIKARPATADDEGVQTFTGNTSIFVNGDAAVCPLVYVTADCTISGGTLDGNEASQAYWRANFTGSGGNFAALVVGGGIVASKTASGVGVLRVRDVTLQNFFGASIGAEYMDRLEIARIAESGGQSCGIVTFRQQVSPNTRGGPVIITDSVFSGPRSLNGNGDPFVMDGSQDLKMSGCIWDNRDNAFSTGPFGSASKLQNHDNATICGNTFRNCYLTIQNATGVTGTALLIDGNEFSSGDPTNYRAGVDGSTGIYAVAQVSNNVVTNGLLSVNNSCGRAILRGNTVRALVSCLNTGISGGSSAALLSANPTDAAVINPVEVSGNTIEGGGFAGHIGFQTPGGGASRLIFEGNRIFGCDIATASGIGIISASDDDWVWRFAGNTFGDNRALGRVNFPQIGRFEFVRNTVLGADAAQTPTAALQGGYGGRALYLPGLSGQFASHVIIRDNVATFSAAYTDYFLHINSPSVTIAALEIVGNYVDAGGGSFTMLLQPAGATVTDFLVARNSSRDGYILNQMSYTTARCFGNDGTSSEAPDGVDGLDNAFAEYPTVAALIATDEPSRGTGAIWRADNYAFAEVGSGFGSPDVTTASGVKMVSAPLGLYGSVTQTTVGAAGAASALPAQPTGYAEIEVEGTRYVVPYYAKS